jgi:hypothetical protein
MRPGKGMQSLMPPRDPRLCPDLERARPADSTGDSDYRSVREIREVLFGDGEWREVQLRAQWLDMAGRLVIQLEWSANRERWTEAYVSDPERVRDD